MTKHEAIEVLEEVKMFDDSMFTYSQAYNDVLDMAIDALKAQEPVRPLIANDMYFCGSCKYAIPRTTNYCPKCGKKVEWND
jgi:rubrerythrin